MLEVDVVAARHVGGATDDISWPENFPWELIIAARYAMVRWRTCLLMRYQHDFAFTSFELQWSLSEQQGESAFGGHKPCLYGRQSQIASRAFNLRRVPSCISEYTYWTNLRTNNRFIEARGCVQKFNQGIHRTTTRSWGKQWLAINRDETHTMLLQAKNRYSVSTQLNEFPADNRATKTSSLTKRFGSMAHIFAIRISHFSCQVVSFEVLH